MIAANCAGSWDLRPGPPSRSRRRGAAGAEEVALERKKQFEAVYPLLLDTGEVLAVLTLEDLTPAKLVYATKSGASARPTGCGCRAQKAAAGA